jgi:hypothetical protein
VVHALPGVEKPTLFLVTRSVSTIQQFGVLVQVLNSTSRAAGRGIRYGQERAQRRRLFLIDPAIVGPDARRIKGGS